MPLDRRNRVQIDFAEIRKLVIIALFSDDTLMQQVVLKGGNALSLVYGLTSRTSLDLDFSLETDFPDLADAERRIFAALRKTFESRELVVFDEKLERRPAVTRNEKWGGYQAEFKLAERSKFEEFQGDVEQLRRNSLAIGPGSLRRFIVDFSKYEYCEPKVETELDDYTIFVYTPQMIAVEKTRAICQQMPEYTLNPIPRPRARDFYDVFGVIERFRLDFGSDETRTLFEHIFEAKQVPLALIAKIGDTREFHRPDWPAVENSVSGLLQPFDYYFDFVVTQLSRLQTLREE